MMKIKDIPMIEDKPPVFLIPQMLVSEAAKILSDFNIGAAPVIENDKLVGIVSERDLLKKVMALKADPDQTTVADIMTKNPLTVSLEDYTSKAIKMMQTHDFRHVPVVDENNHLIAFLSQRVFLTYS